MKLDYNMKDFCWIFQLLKRRSILYEKSTSRHHMLEQSYEFQIFERDCDETKGWINEKLKIASDESYLVSNRVFSLSHQHVFFAIYQGIL